MSLPVRISELRLSTLHDQASREFLRSLLPSLANPPSWPSLARVEFTVGDTSHIEQPGALPAFWKLSVFTDDITALSAKLSAAGVEVSEPVQFGHVGYLSHLHEPGGNSIELIQRTFKDSPPVELAGPDTLGLITLRISDPAVSARFYTDGLGMQLLCTMAVDDGRPDPFDLYFYGYVSEPPPDADPGAVSNREWLYQRQATIIELQHYRPPTPGLQMLEGEAPGLDGVVLEADQLDAFVERLRSSGVHVDVIGRTATFTSPDGHAFTCASVED